MNAFAKWKGEITVGEYVGQLRKWESGLIQRFQNAVLAEGHPLANRQDARQIEARHDSHKIQQDIFYHARHHEIPTFCIDFSGNFAVAAWFATRGNPAVVDSCEDPTEWISIWVLDFNFVTSNLSWCLYSPIELYHAIPRVKRQYSVLSGDLNVQQNLAETMKFQPMEYSLERFLATDRMPELTEGDPKAKRFLLRAIDIKKLNNELRYRNDLSYSYLFPSMLNDIATGAMGDYSLATEQLTRVPQYLESMNGYIHVT